MISVGRPFAAISGQIINGSPETGFGARRGVRGNRGRRFLRAPGWRGVTRSRDSAKVFCIHTFSFAAVGGSYACQSDQGLAKSARPRLTVGRPLRESGNQSVEGQKLARAEEAAPFTDPPREPG